MRCLIFTETTQDNHRVAAAAAATAHTQAPHPMPYERHSHKYCAVIAPQCDSHRFKWRSLRVSRPMPALALALHVLAFNFTERKFEMCNDPFAHKPNSKRSQWRGEREWEREKRQSISGTKTSSNFQEISISFRFVPAKSEQVSLSPDPDLHIQFAQCACTAHHTECPKTMRCNATVESSQCYDCVIYWNGSRMHIHF